jgi:hypothetical protein
MAVAGRVAVVALAAAVLFGCGGGGKKKPPAVAAPTTSTTSTTVPPVVNVAKTINYEEFTVAVLTAEARPADNVLKLLTQVTNTLSSPQEFNPTFNVTSAGETYEGRAAKNPTIAPNAAVPVPVELDVGIDTRFTMSDAVIIFGNTTKNQPMLPLGTSGKFVPLLDVAAQVPGAVTVGEQVFTFTNAAVSAFEYDGSELDAGTRELQLTMSVHNNDPAHPFKIDGTDFKFVNGAETLNSAVVKPATANAGGSVNKVRVYADVDNYAPGGTLGVTIVGADAQQGKVGTPLTIALPPLE